MCLFGSGGGPTHESNIYLEEQQSRERERQAAIKAAQARINSMFDPNARAPIYENVQSSYQDALLSDLNDQYEEARQQAKVNLARSGQYGGSADVGIFKKLQDAYNKAVLKANTESQRVSGNLRTSDQDFRGRLISQAFGGLGANDAASIGNTALQGNLNNYLADAQDASLGDVFAGIANNYAGGRAQAGRTLAGRDFKNQYSTYFPGGGDDTYGGSVVGA